VTVPDDDNDDQSKPPSRLDSILKLVKLLAIIVSGCWVLFQFLSFQSESNRISLKQQEIAKEQSNLNLQIATATQQATISQAKMSAEEAELTLRTQQAEKELRELELKYTVDEKRLDAQSKKLTIISRTTYKAAKQSRWVARELRDGLIQVLYHPGITNASEESFEVSSIAVNVYAGYINPEAEGNSVRVRHIPLQDEEGGAALRQLVVSPPRYGEQVRTEGAVTWRRIASRASVYSEALSNPRASYFISQPYEFDSFGTGVWKSGEEVQFEPEVLIDPKGIDFIGFSVRMIFNRREKDEDDWWFSDWQPLTALLNHDHTEKGPSSVQASGK
jgi:hypothetical protein